MKTRALLVVLGCFGMAVQAAEESALAIADELKAWGKFGSLVTGAIGFEMPNEDGLRGGVRGGRGVLIRNELTTGRSGSTWSFDYIRSGDAFGVEIIHPQGRGEVLVCLDKESIAIATPSSWIKVGWSGRNTKRIALTKEGAAIFPLKDEQKYEVVSQLTAMGR